MSSFTSRDFLAAAKPRHQFLIAQREQLEAQARSFDEDIARLDALHDRTRQEMASYMLAEVGDSDLTALQHKLRYPGLMGIKARFEEELEQSEAERRALEAKPELEHNEFHVSQTQDELDALREACEGYRRRMSGWEQSRWFQELDGRGFFHRGYEPDFFNRFWDWRAISWLMDDLEENLELDFPTPDAIRSAWVALRDEATPVLEVWDDLTGKLEELRGLKNRHDALLRAPEEIFQRMVLALGEAILDHLEASPPNLKISMAKGDPFLVTFFKKDAGLEKQIQYLKELKVARIQPLIQSLDTELNKLRRKAIKAERKYKTYDARTIQGLRNLKREKWTKRHAKLTKIRGRVAGFKHYEQGDFTDDYLWWDAMTRGAPADDIYEVRTFRRRRPNWNWRTYEDPWRDHHSHREPSRTAMDTAAPALADRMQPSNDDDDWSLDAS